MNNISAENIDIFNEKVYWAVLDEMNKRFPQEELSYRNGIIASMMAKGLAYRFTEDWLRIVLLGDVEDGFLTYGQAVYIKDSYFKAICEVKKMKWIFV